MFNAAILLSYVLLFVSASAAQNTVSPATQNESRLSVAITNVQTCDHLGACQGASEHDGFIYLYGDANPGVIRQYTVTAGDVPTLEFTGLEISLTVKGVNLINHPAGLTWNSHFGTYLGNTITATKKGTIYHLNWPQMLIDRTLDHAILNVIDDDLAIQGCRPEFIRHGDNWYLATADYGNVKNAVRIYDPAKLASASKTSAPGVMVEQHPCGAFVQQLHWIDSRQQLLIIENQIVGRRRRLIAVDPWATADFRSIKPYDDLPGLDELEGFTLLDPQRCILVTSSRKNNCTFGKFSLRN